MSHPSLKRYGQQTSGQTWTYLLIFNSKNDRKLENIISSVSHFWTPIFNSLQTLKYSKITGHSNMIQFLFLLFFYCFATKWLHFSSMSSRLRYYFYYTGSKQGHWSHRKIDILQKYSRGSIQTKVYSWCLCTAVMWSKQMCTDPYLHTPNTSTHSYYVGSSCSLLFQLVI